MVTEIRKWVPCSISFEREVVYRFINGKENMSFPSGSFRKVK